MEPRSPHDLAPSAASAPLRPSSPLAHNANGAWRSGAFGWGALQHIIFQRTSISLFVCDSEGTITLANAAGRQLAKMDPEGTPLRVAGLLWGELNDTSGNSVPANECPWMEALRGQTVAGRHYRLVRGNDVREVLVGAAPISAESSQLIGAVISFTDLSEIKQEVANLCDEAVHRERNRIATELHDTLAQELNAIVLQLELADAEFDRDPDRARHHCRRAREIARDGLKEARREIWMLEDVTEDSDLALALSSVAERLFSGAPTKPIISVQQPFTALSEAVRGGLFRIGREAMVNVLKHAAANHVRVTLAFNERHARLTVEDDGQGFVPSLPCRGHGGFGIHTMRSRIRGLRGELAIESRPGHGTTVAAVVPI